MVSPSNIITDKHERVIELERLLAAKRATVEDLDTWAESLREEADASSQRAGELRQKIDELDIELARVNAAPANAWEDAQYKLNDMWNDISQQVDELASRVETKDFGQ